MQAVRITVPRIGARAFSTTAPRPLAKMSLIGRLADVPELQDTATGRQIVRYALGVSSGSRDENGNRGVSWFKVASFQNEGPQRDLLLSLPKGALVFVEADAKMDSYDAQDGSKRTALNLVQRSFETLSRPQTRESEADPVQHAQSGVGAS